MFHVFPLALYLDTAALSNAPRVSCILTPLRVEYPPPPPESVDVGNCRLPKRFFALVSVAARLRKKNVFGHESFSDTTKLLNWS